MDITGIATERGLALLSDYIKENITEYAILGTPSKTHETLELLVNTPGTPYDALEAYIVYCNDSSAAYYDVEGVLTFTLTLPYDEDFGCYLYGIALLGEIEGRKTVLSLSPIPRIEKFQGIGGTFTYKVAVTGEEGKMLYQKSLDYATDEEAMALIRSKAADPYQVKMLMNQFGMFGSVIYPNNSEYKSMDDFIKTGKYYIEDSIADSPYKYGHLEVSGNSSSKAVLQVFTSHRYGIKRERQKYWFEETGWQWGPWKTVGDKAPDSKYINISIAKYGDTYTAPANGYICVHAYATSPENNGFVRIFRSNDPGYGASCVLLNGIGTNTVLSVKKGDCIVFHWSVRNTVNLISCRFYPSEEIEI